ncbi:MAG: septal ring lytic transglycosylase RlpA family protein [Burkholderiaceae bacterium]|nr:septal ring lytic transglycosylase RlpA family protein [Sulfuritalea sp.]MCF8174979.1 septal ring lytic transglycosylase RlpA family protein [Burkholderiaceae bacterium]
MGKLQARCARQSRGASNDEERRCAPGERAAGPRTGLAPKVSWRALIPLAALFLAACGTQAPRPVIDRGETDAVSPAPTFKAQGKKPAIKYSGGFYKDDGPGDAQPEDIDAIPDATPRVEPLHRFANNPYTVLGQSYVPQREIKPYKVRGIGSWYGRKFHGQKTSSGEPYDMYGMTAAHPTLPIPSYVRVSNPANGKSVVVRVNDRGPFHAGRLIDLSWTAAYKLDYIGEGSTLVEVESVLPGQTLVAVSPIKTEEAITQIDATEPDTPLPRVEAAGGHFLQLGAFGNRDNAEALHARLTRELGSLAQKLVIQSAGSVFRVQLGPWLDAAAAEQAAILLRESLGMRSVRVQR